MNGIREKIRELGPWFHNLHMPDGSQTAPDHKLGDFPDYKWKEISPHIPQNLNGWRVLDIGCNAGFYSIQLARRGALVTGIDIDPHYLRQGVWAVEQFKLQDKIRFEQMQVYDLARIKETYDLVWYMGVFYHLRYPFLSLDIVSRITRRMMVFQTLSLPGSEKYAEHDNVNLFKREEMNQEGWPKMAFIEHSLADDPTNWWAPNSSCVMAMMRSSGFKVLGRPSDEVYICERDGVHRLEHDDMRELEYRAATGLNGGIGGV